jgi:two-component sensor histidine kinase
LRSIGDRITGCVVTMADLTARKRAEERQLLLMAELDHRVKNTLTTVLAICSRTLSGHQTLDSFKAAFEGRIRALAETHNLLSQNRWLGVSLRQVLEVELAPYVDGSSERVAYPADDVLLTPRAALGLGLVFHELVTNAVKYGAFVTETGKVDCTWEQLNDMDGPRLRIVWREDSGRPIPPPTRRGFGRTIVELGLSFELGGSAELEFLPNGVVCRMDLPASEVLPTTFQQGLGQP